MRTKRSACAKTNTQNSVVIYFTDKILFFINFNMINFIYIIEQFFEKMSDVLSTLH